MPLHLSDVDVRDLAGEVLLELAPIIAESGLEVGKSIARDLPLLYTDRSKVKQILLNLLGNALKFTRRGSVRIVATLAPDGGAAITVKDTGIGIPASDLTKIFEDFRQLNMSPSRGHGGTGLGLAICRRLALILGGKITVESQVGRGSAFTVWLPLTSRTS
jgi:signal transduction histidine kinase